MVALSVSLSLQSRVDLPINLAQALQQRIALLLAPVVDAPLLTHRPRVDRRQVWKQRLRHCRTFTHLFAPKKMAALRAQHQEVQTEQQQRHQLRLAETIRSKHRQPGS
jgi:hypothetical protein